MASGGSFYIVGAVSIDMDSISVLTSTDSTCKCWPIETSYYFGRYVDLGDGHSILVIQPRADRITLGPEEFNQSIEGQLTEELLVVADTHNIASLKKIHIGVFWGLVEVYLHCLSFYFDLSLDQLQKIKLINTHIQLNYWYQKISDGVHPQNNLYLDIFSKMYFIEIQLISRLFDIKTPINIHDVATSSANLPNLLNFLATRGKLPFTLNRIECSDQNASPAMRHIEILSKKFEHKYLIKTLRIDFTKDNFELSNVDVVIANDVLEHFEEADSFNALVSLWKHVQDVLIIHVPIETELAHHFGHLSHFTQEKLNEWSKRLPFCLNITDELLNYYKKDFFVDGFLVLRRQKKTEVRKLEKLGAE